MRIAAAFLLGLLLCAGRGNAGEGAATPLDIYLHPQTLAHLPDGRALHFFCLGDGAPIVIVDAGWGDWSTRWRGFQPELAKQSKVCVLDRPGYGFSDRGPLPRDAAATVADLQAGLSAAGLPPPYVLVGHSLGGFHMRLFAYRYPAETAGLLLIDPPTERIYQRDRVPDEDLDEVRRCLSLAKKAPLSAGAPDGCVPQPAEEWSAAMRDRQIRLLGSPALFETELSEDLSMVGRSADQLADARHSLGRMPLIILQADAPPQDERSRELDLQAADSSRGRHVIVTGASHYIQNDRPDVVIGSLRDILAAARDHRGE